MTFPLTQGKKQKVRIIVLLLILLFVLEKQIFEMWNLRVT